MYTLLNSQALMIHNLLKLFRNKITLNVITLNEIINQPLYTMNISQAIVGVDNMFFYPSYINWHALVAHALETADA